MITYAIRNVARGWERDAFLALVGHKVTPQPAWKDTIPLKSAVVAIGGCGGIAIFFEVTGAQAGNGWYSPYYSQADNQDDEKAIHAKPDAWLNGMAGATEWAEWDWDGPYDDIPMIY